MREALSLAYDAHYGQKRKSGEPFITHPVEVGAGRGAAAVERWWWQMRGHAVWETCGQAVPYVQHSALA